MVEEDNTPLSVTVTPCDTPLEWKLSLQELPEEASTEGSGEQCPVWVRASAWVAESWGNSLESAGRPGAAGDPALPMRETGEASDGGDRGKRKGEERQLWALKEWRQVAVWTRASGCGLQSCPCVGIPAGGFTER